MLQLDQLKLYCTASIDELFESIDGEIVGKPGDQYAYRDNNSNILGIAHCDTVQRQNHFCYSNGLVFNPKLDDRLGVYTLVDLLPSLGIRLDILLTENEEIAQSTAQSFETDKRYNWIVEFDRRGCDVVSYCYDFDSVLKKYFKIGRGTFSDICYLEHLSCKGFNLGIGYHSEHAINAYMSIKQYTTNIQRFIAFYTDNKDTFFDHVPLPSCNETEDLYWNQLIDYGRFDQLVSSVVNSRQGGNE